MKRLVPRFLAMFLALMLVCACALADTMYAFCKPKDFVTVRAFPTTKAEQMGYLDCGDSVEVTGNTARDKQGRKWLEVTGFEGDAWVCAMYLSESPVQTEDCYGYVAVNGRTAVRRSPNGKRIKWYKNGTEFPILAMTDDWVLTREGYIKRDCVEVFYGRVE